MKYINLGTSGRESYTFCGPQGYNSKQNTTITAFHTDDSEVLRQICVNFSKHC